MCLGQGLYVELFLIGAFLQAAEMAKKKYLLAQTSTFETNVVCFLTETSTTTLDYTSRVNKLAK